MLNKENKLQCNKVINAYPKEHQLLLLMEELSELIQATSKLVRYGEMESFLEEYADVQVMLEEMRQMYHIDDKEIGGQGIGEIHIHEVGQGDSHHHGP